MKFCVVAGLLPSRSRDVFSVNLKGGNKVRLLGPEIYAWNRAVCKVIIGSENTVFEAAFSVTNMDGTVAVKVNKSGTAVPGIKFGYKVTGSEVYLFLYYNTASSNNVGLVVMSQSAVVYDSSIDWTSVTEITL